MNRKYIVWIFFLIQNGFLFSEPQVATLYDLMQACPEISYRLVHKAQLFSYPQLPVANYAWLHPSSGMFAQDFVLMIPQGKVCSAYGYVLINNHFVKELIPQNYPASMYEKGLENLAQKIMNKVPKKVSGRVVVLGRFDFDCYGHWLGELLPRLALLKELGVEYDLLYVPYHKKYIQESLALLGIDSKKIIQPYDEHFYIQAEELIVPSLTARRIPRQKEKEFCKYSVGTMYCPMWVVNFLRNAFLPLVDQQIDVSQFNKKVFISRKDAGQRRMLNEDELFELFEEKGFTRYCMSELSFLEQVALFKQAEVVVAAHGSALTNIVFAMPGTTVCEIFQNQFDSTFWQLSYQVGCQHHCIKTQEREPIMVKVDTHVDVDIVKKYIQDYLPDL